MFIYGIVCWLNEATEKFKGTSDKADLVEADAILICVPTPLGKHNDPDLSYVLSCTELIREIMRPGQLIALESTTYPGTTRNEMMPHITSTHCDAQTQFVHSCLQWIWANGSSALHMNSSYLL